MRAIFISYRRSDAEGQAGRLFRDLSDRFGKAAVFMDVASIDPGRDFRVVLNDTLATCGALISMIGPDWLGAPDAAGRRRIDNPHDYIRLETAAALKRDIPVFPVLVREARMPLEEELPEDLKGLAFRQATEIRHAHWDSDVRELGDVLARYVDTSPAPIPPPDREKPGRSPHRGQVLVGLAIAAMLALGAYAVERRPWDAPVQPSMSDSAKHTGRLPGAGAPAAVSAPVDAETTIKKRPKSPASERPAVDISAGKKPPVKAKMAVTTYQDFPAALTAVVADAKNNFANLRGAKDGDNFAPAIAIADSAYRLFDILQSPGYWVFQIQSAGNIEDVLKEYEYKRQLFDQVFAKNGLKYELVNLGAPGTAPLQSYEFKSPQLIIQLTRTPKGKTYLHTVWVLHPT
jgi:hypothetical protein